MEGSKRHPISGGAHPQRTTAARDDTVIDGPSKIRTEDVKPLSLNRPSVEFGDAEERETSLVTDALSSLSLKPGQEQYQQQDHQQQESQTKQQKDRSENQEREQQQQKQQQEQEQELELEQELQQEPLVLPYQESSMFKALNAQFRSFHRLDARLLDGSMATNNFWDLLQEAEAAESVGHKIPHALTAIKGALDQMRRSDSRLLPSTLQIIADSSKDVSWRAPLGDAGLLEVAVDVIRSDQSSEDACRHALRLIGNACIDTDQNRRRILDEGAISPILDQLHNPHTSDLAVPVLLNVCDDYEPVRKQAQAEALYSRLIELLISGELDRKPSFSSLCSLIEQACEGLDESDIPPHAVEKLFNAACKPDLNVDDYACLGRAAISHLKLESFQQRMVAKENFELVLRFLLRSYFPHGDLHGNLELLIASPKTQSWDQSDEEELSEMRKALIEALSDVSALPSFTAAYASMDSRLVGILAQWLGTALPQLQLTSCIVLGNLARSDAVCRMLVLRNSIQKDIVTILRKSSDSQVIHSTLGFLRNLALPVENKEVLGNAETMRALRRFWTPETMPQISYVAASVARQLANNCAVNARRLLEPLSADADSPAHSRTGLSLLLLVFEKSDDSTARAEIARIVPAVLRSLLSDTSIDGLEVATILERLYTLHSNLGGPLGMMVSQSRFPVLRSEGWFTLALASRTSRGCAVAQAALSDVKVFVSLEEAIRGGLAYANANADEATSSRLQPSSHDARAKDRQNALILINNLLRHGEGAANDTLDRGILEGLLQEGARLEQPNGKMKLG